MLVHMDWPGEGYPYARGSKGLGEGLDGVPCFLGGAASWQIRISQRFFSLPGPPNFLLSRQKTHFSQSSMRHSLQLPQGIFSAKNVQTFYIYQLCYLADDQLRSTFLGQQLLCLHFCAGRKGSFGLSEVRRMQVVQKYLAPDLCLKAHLKFVGGCWGRGGALVVKDY